jgi:hypothetical protein
MVNNTQYGISSGGGSGGGSGIVGFGVVPLL